MTNHYYLEEIGFDPQNPVQPAPTCASETPLARNQTAPRKTRILRPNKEFVFSAAPQDRSSIAAPPIRVYSRLCAPHGFRDPCTKKHKPRTAAICRSPDNYRKDSHLSKIGFLSQKKTHSASADCASARRADRQPLSEPYWALLRSAARFHRERIDRFNREQTPGHAGHKRRRLAQRIVAASQWSVPDLP